MVLERRRPEVRRDDRWDLSVVKWVKGLTRYLVERKGDTVTDVGGSRERRWVTTVSCIV